MLADEAEGEAREGREAVCCQTPGGSWSVQEMEKRRELATKRNVHCGRSGRNGASAASRAEEEHGLK